MREWRYVLRVAYCVNIGWSPREEFTQHVTRNTFFAEAMVATHVPFPYPRAGEQTNGVLRQFVFGNWDAAALLAGWPLRFCPRG